MHDERILARIHANKTESRIVFRDELDRIAAGGFPQLKITHFLSNPDENLKGESGHISKDLIAASFEEPGQTESTAIGIYLCGPPPMMAEIKGFLVDLGVSENRIHLEAFEF